MGHILNPGIWLRVFGGFIGLSLAFSAYGEQSLPQTKEEPEKPFTLSIAVEEVRLDTIVLDNKGRQIIDMTADDFELYQDGIKKKITACTYISDYWPTPDATPIGQGIVRPKGSAPAPQSPNSVLAKDTVRRTIIFLVDDFRMTLTIAHRVRFGLQKFVETQMQPGDLVAILRTNRGDAGHLIFTSDKRKLLEMIKSIRFAFNMYGGGLPQFMTTAYCIRALKNMPGHKSLILITTQSELPTDNTRMSAFDGLADLAFRAGVVIHHLDAQGLASLAGPEPLPNGTYHPGTDNGPSIPDKYRVPLYKKTGGVFDDRNWFLNGIDEVNEAIKGYYMLTYVPPGYTFRPEGRSSYHHIEIRTKRPGAEVHYRDGFLGTPQAADIKPVYRDPMIEAIFSPFENNGLKISMVSGYIDDPQKNYLIRSWVHLAPENLSITKNDKGAYITSLKAVCVTTDINGNVQDSNGATYEISTKEENLSWVKTHGIRFSLLLPVKKSGAYYVRTAVKDQVSGKIGSAYQFIDIPNIRKSSLVLSSIFAVDHDDDSGWIQSGVINEIPRNLLYPDLRRYNTKSPALRTYELGDSLEYAAIVYNPAFDKQQMPDLESHFVLFRDGQEVYRSNPEPVDIRKIGDPKRIPVKVNLHIPDVLQPGDYLLQLIVNDKRVTGKHGLATQTFNFEVPALPEREQHN